MSENRYIRIDWDLESFDSWAEALNADSPERRLLVAIIQRAVLDYTQALQRRKATEISVKAMCWLYNPNIEPWGFRWVCHWLSDDGDKTRLDLLTAIQARIKKGGTRFCRNVHRSANNAFRKREKEGLN